MDHRITTRIPDIVLIDETKKLRTYHLLDFTGRAAHRMKMKESEKILKNTWTLQEN